MTAPASSNHAPLWQWPATDIVRATRNGEISCHDVTASVVERLRAVNPALNAITLDQGDEALDCARRLDQARAGGATPGPLFGVPVTIKDNVDVRGQRTPNGVAGWANVVAPDHSPVVKNLLDAGAVIVGRTNAPEFSMRATTNNPLYGLTRNPWDARISCGGSSGGAGVAVAMGMGAIAHGNDIGGSIRFPALHCGVTGLKPSLGRVPAYLPSGAAERPFMSAFMSVQGPLARCVADLRLGLAAMAAPDARDPFWAPAPLQGPPTARRVGLVSNIPGLTIAPEVAGGLRAAAQALVKAGYVVEEITPPDLSRSGELALRLLSTDIQHQMLPVARKLGSAQINWYLDTWFAVAPPFATAGELLDAQAARNTLLRQWQMLMTQHPLILIPQRMQALLEVDEDLRSEAALTDILHGLAPSVTFNLLGMPSVLAPTGLADGLPMGVQVVAERFREDICLAAAEAIEQGCGTLSTTLWGSVPTR